jgi:hypothetical protein
VEGIIFDTKRRGDSRRGRILGRVFSRDGKSARLVSVDLFSFSNERCSHASTVSPARVIDRLEAHARRAVRAFFFSVIS